MCLLSSTLLALSIIAFVLVSALLICAKKSCEKYEMAKKIVGPRSIPILGNIQFFNALKPAYLLQTIQKLQAKYGQTFRLWLGTELWVFLYSPDEVRQAFNDLSLYKPQVFEHLRMFLGNGLFLSHDNYWVQQRKFLSPAFRFSILKDYRKKITRHVDVLIDRLCKDESKTVNVIDYLFPCILDVIIDALMGQNLHIQAASNDEYHRAFQTISKLLFERMTNPLLHSNFIYKLTRKYRRLTESISIVNKLMDSIIEEGLNNLLLHIKTSTHCGKAAPSNLLNLLLANRMEEKNSSKTLLRDELNTFMFAGVDTTVTAMSYVLYALVKYPNEQEKLREEIHHVKTTMGIRYLEELNRYEYLDQFLKECLRFYTVIPITGRRTKSTTKIGQHIYPPGVNIWVNIYGLAHNPKYFDQPNDFRPSRFARRNHSEQSAFSYIPFGAGPHMCIGRRFADDIMKIMTIKILETFELYLPKACEEELHFMARMTLTCKPAIYLQIRKK